MQKIFKNPLIKRKKKRINQTNIVSKILKDDREKCEIIDRAELVHIN